MFIAFRGVIQFKNKNIILCWIFKNSVVQINKIYLHIPVTNKRYKCIDIAFINIYVYIFQSGESNKSK